MWFVGSHADIGGGYVKRGLADHSLEWMVGKAKEYGLPVNMEAIEGDTANHVAAFNDSAVGYKTVWGLLTKKRRVLPTDIFHWSVADERALVADVVPALPDASRIVYTPKPNTEAAMA